MYSTLTCFKSNPCISTTVVASFLIRLETIYCPIIRASWPKLFRNLASMTSLPDELAYLVKK